MSAPDSPAPCDQPKRQPALSRENRTRCNDLLPAGYSCAVLFAPGSKVRPRVLPIKLPRSSSGKARRGVHIPLSSFEQARRVKPGKHRRQKSQRWSWERAAKPRAAVEVGA